MRLAPLVVRVLAPLLGLCAGACTCAAADPAPEAPAPETPAPETPAPETPAPEVTPRRPLPVASEPGTRTAADELPPLAVTEADQARVNEVLALGGFALGQSLAEARARCAEVGGELAHVERAIHRCTFAPRENEPRAHVDVVLTPGAEPGPVGRVVFVYTSGAGEPLIPSFAGVTGTMFARIGPPRSRAETPECAVATATLLKACLERDLEAVQHSWSTGANPAGDAERMGEAGVEEVVVALAPAGQTWRLSLAHQAAGYGEAFMAAYQEEPAEE